MMTNTSEMLLTIVYKCY